MAIARQRCKAPTMRGSAPDGLQGDSSVVPCATDLPPWGTTGSTSHYAGTHTPAGLVLGDSLAKRVGTCILSLPRIAIKFYGVLSDKT